MKAFRAVLLATVALAVSAAAVEAQAPVVPSSSSANGLPPGLIRQGGVVMMQPIQDAGEGGVPEPQITGERRVGLVRILPASDHDLYTQAFEAIDRGDWTAARGLADQGHDPIARKLVEWRYLLDKNSGAPFAEISQFLKDNPDWPDRDTLMVRAETAMDPAMEPHAVVAWFADREPLAGIGRIRLGEALIATSAPTRGHALIRQAWVEDSFDPDQEFAITQRHGDILTPDVDRERLDHLLWHNDVTAARRELARVDGDARRIAEARMELRSSPASGERLVENLPDASRNDPGLLFDRARLLRQEGQIDEAASLLAHAPTHEMAKIAPTRWWAELNLDARDALQQSSYHSAYSLTMDTGLAPDSTEYSEAEFLAGWIALRYLKEPKSALAHFQDLAKAVTRPISRARAHYWEGRCDEASGDLAAAWQQYRLASQSPETFYGELALARIETAPTLHLSEPAIDANAARASFEHEELTRAIRVLADLGLESLLRSFSVHDADLYSDPRHVKLLAEDLTRMGFKEIAVRVAKEESYNGPLLLSYSYPVIPVPGYPAPGTAPDAAYVLGIIRQETEFDPDAVSGAGARGIMQVMPYTARKTANVAGLEYRPADLVGDPVYNMQLGMTELGGDLSDWGGSYVLAAAAYNAGPGNVRKWIATYGDPRDARVDPVDWIEQIPFNETRNYVQRVIENMEIYRNRISGHDEPLHILADIYRPNAPQGQVLQYAPPAASPAAQSRCRCPGRM